MLRILLVLLLGATAFAQEEVAVEFQEAQDHRLGAVHSLHAKIAPAFGNNIVRLKVIVNESGKVESAHCISGPDEFYGDAESLELTRRFKPFERNGGTVRASLVDDVLIFPPEQRLGKEIPFPEIRDWRTLRIKLERTGCYGWCPAYSVEVSGEGDVEFDGLSDVLILGHHRGHVSEQTVRNLVSEFKKAGYFSLKDNYSALITDCPTFKTSIEFDGRLKSVRDFMGIHTGMPEAVSDLELAIDEMAGTEKWVKGNDRSGPALVAEKWDFRSDSDENKRLFANLVSQGSEDLIRLFVENGAAPLTITKDGNSALISAAERGNLELVRIFLDKETKGSAPVITGALGAAAQTGNLALVRYLIEKGGDPNGQLFGRKYETKTVLMEAAELGKADVVEEILKYHPDVNAVDRNGFTALDYLCESGAKQDTREVIAALLAAGADVNHRDGDEQTPLFRACSSANVKAVEILLKAGADLNARRSGQTVLMLCGDLELLKALVAAGADPSARDNEGHTAADNARQYGMNEKADLLEAAMKEQEAKRRK